MLRRSVLGAAAEPAASVVGSGAATLSTLAAQRDRLAEKAFRAGQTVDAALATRRHLHLTDGAPDAMRLAEDAVRAAESEKAGIDDALAVITAQIGEAEAAIASTADRAEREPLAVALEARAERLTKAAVQLDRAAEAFDDARKALVACCYADALPDPMSGHYPDGQIVRAAARLAGAVPTTDSDRIFAVPASAYGAAHEHVEALKAEATAIRSGTKAPPAPVEIYRLRSVPNVRIVLSRPITYMDGVSPQTRFAGEVDVPGPIAVAATAAGIGFDPNSSDGAAIRKVVGDFGIGATLKRRNDNVWVLDIGEPVRDGGLPIGPGPLWLDGDLSAERARIEATAA